MKYKSLVILFSVCTLFLCGQCSKSDGGGGSGGGGGTTPPPVTPPPTPVNEVDLWVTKADQSAWLQKQTDIISFGAINPSYTTIAVDSTVTYQSVDGFGYTLTGSSAWLINHMGTAEKASLLNELFGNSTTSIGVSYLRISIGASDLSQTVFSYDDLPAGGTDPGLTNFSLAPDETDLIPILKQILLINPSIKIMGSPWSPPVWMKDNGNSIGGSLLPAYYSTYANYLVKYVQQMQLKGIPIHAMTIQNEPQHGGNNPSMLMSATQQADFIKNNLGPAFTAAGITTKIIVWDHNCDNPNYPITVLNDAAARPYIDGSAFHLYAGDISALSTVHNAYPTKNLYFTEQWTGSTGSFDGDLKWHTKNVVIGSMRNWSKIALEWNLASDPAYSMHTPGGCTQCKGAITINGNNVSRNVGYYIIAHASKFVPAGSVRIETTSLTGIPSVAFKTPDGKKVLVVLNESTASMSFNLQFKGKVALASLPPGSVGTFTW